MTLLGTWGLGTAEKRTLRSSAIRRQRCHEHRYVSGKQSGAADCAILLEPAPLWTPLHNLYKIVWAWLDFASDAEIRSLLATAGEARPPEWQQEYRINLHLDHVPKETLHQLMVNLLVTEVFYNAWVMDKRGARPESINARSVAEQSASSSVDAMEQIVRALSAMTVADGLHAVAGAVLLWAYHCDEDLVRENAIATGHYDESMGHDGLVKHALRTFYMGFTGA
jgi:hypothetical protein